LVASDPLAIEIVNRQTQLISNRGSKLGLLFVVRGDWLTRIDHKGHEIIEEAFKIRQKHNDPFDCFIFATTRVQEIPLVTEDRVAREFLDDRLVMTWAGLKKNLKV